MIATMAKAGPHRARSGALGFRAGSVKFILQVFHPTGPEE
jgi:hypothetical protein